MSDNTYTSSGAVVKKTTEITSGEIWLDTQVSSGGYLNVFSGGIASGSEESKFYVVKGGCIRVASGGRVEKLTVSSGGQLIVVSDGNAESVDIRKNGSARVSSGGIITSSVVSGELNVFSGGSAVGNIVAEGEMKVSGTASGTVLRSGTINVAAGGSAVADVISSGSQVVGEDGTASNALIRGGEQVVSSGGITYDTIVSSGAQVVAGGITANTVVLADGTQEVSSGSALNTWIGLLTQTEVNGRIEDVILPGGEQIITSDGIAQATHIVSGGSQIVTDGGTTEDVRIYDGGTMIVSSGGSLTGSGNISDNGGSAYFYGGAVINGIFATMGEITVGGELEFSSADSGIYLWIDSNNQASINGEAMLHGFSNLGENSANCFISVPGDIRDNTYTLADGAEGFSGSIAIYNDDSFTQTVYVSVGTTVETDYIEYTLRNDNGTLKVDVVNNTIYDKKFSNWTFSENVASLKFVTECAGRYMLDDFISAVNFTGTAAIQDANGKIITSLKVSRGTIADDTKNNILLTAGTYTLVCTAEKSGTIKENSAAHIVSNELFYRANMFNDDEFNQLIQSKTRITVEPKEDSTVSAVISDPVNYYEFVGYSDLTDWRQLNIQQDGVYSIDLSKIAGTGSAMKATLYSVNGTTLKSVGSISVKDAAETATLIKDKQLEAGTYYVEFKSVSGQKGYGTTYGATITGKVYDGADSADTAALTTTLDLDDVNKGRVNFASPELYYSWTVDAPGLYSLSISPDLENSTGNNALSVTVYSAPDGKNALTKVLSFSTKNVSVEQFFDSKEVFLDSGEYFVSVKSSQTNKGADVGFHIESEGESYQVSDDNAGNFLDAKTVDFSGTRGEIIADDVYAGFNAPIEFFELDLTNEAVNGGVFSFTAENSGNGTGSVTIWQLDGNKLKKVKSVSVAAGKTVELKNAQLNADGKYYLQIDGSSAAKSNKYADISVSVSASEFAPAETLPGLQAGKANFASAEAFDPETGLLEYALGGDAPISWFNFDLNNTGGVFSFDVENTGTGNATFGVYQLSDDGNSVKKVKSISVAAGKTAALNSISLAANGTYFLQIDSAAAAKKGLYSQISCSVAADSANGGAMRAVIAADDDAIWQLEYNVSISQTGTTAVTEEGYLDIDNSIDYRKITVENAGFYNFSISSEEHNANLTATLYKWNSAGTALTKVSSALLSAKAATDEIATLKKDIFLTAGDYYISVTCANTARGGCGSYNLNFTAPVVFDHDDINSSDNTISGAAELDELEHFVGYGDTEDFFVWNIEHDGYYNFSIKSDEMNAKLTAVLYKWNSTGTALVKAGTLNLSKAGEVSLKKELLLDQGEYFIGVSCANAAKGGYGYYTLDTSAGTVFDHADINNSDDDIATERKFTLTDGENTVVAGKGGFVGYGDNIDFLEISAEFSGEYTFDIDVSDTLKFTLYRYDADSGKLVSQIKSTTLKEDTLLDPVHLEAGIKYYIEVQTLDKKGESIYSIAATGNAAGMLNTDMEEDSSVDVELMEAGDTVMFNFEVPADQAAWEFAFAESDCGEMELFKYDEKKGTLALVKTVPERDISLAAGNYYIQLEAADDIEKSTLTFDAGDRTFSWEK